MTFSELCDEIIQHYDDARDFAKILKAVYLGEFEHIKKENMEKYNITEKDDLLFYGKNRPIFKSLTFFNEIPVFRKEEDSILFLKDIGIPPSKTLNSLTYEEKIKLRNEFLNISKTIIPREYFSHVPKLIFGKEYYFKDVCLKEYVSALNGIYKIGNKRKVIELIINRKIPEEKDVIKYRKILAKRINLFNKKLDDYEIRNFNINFNGKNFKCQYIYIRQTVWDKILGLFGEGIELKYYPTLVNIAYSSKKIDFLKPFFIFIDIDKNISVYARVPKLLYLKHGLSLNYLKLKGKTTYFGNWERDKFWKIIEKGSL
ncbi:hypothetical protein [Methanocaldococcus sp.]